MSRRRIGYRLVLIATLLAGLSVCIAILSAQDAGGRTVRDGVYTDAQAASGRAIYDGQCGDCHDGGMGPNLKGEDFLERWDGKTARALYERILTTMPAEAPGTLKDKEVLDLLAYLVRANRFPPGTKTLDNVDDLNAIRIVRQK